MTNLVQDQMYIITSSCYKCDEEMNVAIIRRKHELGERMSGPEEFSLQEKELATNNGVLIKEHYSATRQEIYDANTCPHCNAFIGQHYLFTDYLSPAIYGECEYIHVRADDHAMHRCKGGNA